MEKGAEYNSKYIKICNYVFLWLSIQRKEMNLRGENSSLLFCMEVYIFKITVSRDHSLLNVLKYECPVSGI